MGNRLVSHEGCSRFSPQHIKISHQLSMNITDTVEPAPIDSLSRTASQVGILLYPVLVLLAISCCGSFLWWSMTHMSSDGLSTDDGHSARSTTTTTTRTLTPDLARRLRLVESSMIIRPWSARDGGTRQYCTKPNISQMQARNRESTADAQDMDLESANKLVSTTSTSSEVFCLICLGPLDEGDSVSESYNPYCRHVYHRECIVQVRVGLSIVVNAASSTVLTSWTGIMPVAAEPS